ncbi:MAG: response regulator [Candidatus Lokiarchaeia archaeon]
MKILIVDDNPSFLMLFQVYTKDYPQFEFLYVESGEEALKILDSEKGRDISLIVSDIRMPTLSGFDLSRIVKEKYPKIPIMLITGMESSYFSEEDLMFSTKFLNKNIGCEGILEEIKVFFDG